MIAARLAADARRDTLAIPSAAQLASPFACRLLARVLRRERPRRVLEVGAGYGTLTAILAAVCPQAEIVSIEDDPDCRIALQRRLAWAPHWLVQSSDDWTNALRHVDVLVVDGGDRRPDYYASLRSHALVIVEGGRREQRALMERCLLAWQRPFCAMPRKPLDRSKGVWLYRLDPTAWERLGYAIVRGLEGALDAVVGAFGHPIGKRRAIRI